jgi:hypothetical protein
MATFSIGRTARERIEVEVLAYERARSGEYHDDNWLRVNVSISAGAFSGRFHAAFLTDELVRFRDQIQTLYRTLQGEASFRTLEEQLSLRLTGNGRGEIGVRGVAVDIPGTGNRLEFELMLDQSYLQSTLGSLNEVIDQFPVRAG